MKQLVQRKGFIHVALNCGGGMGIDVVYVVHTDTCILQGSGHGNDRTAVAGFRDATTVARKTITHNLGQYGGTSGHGVLVVFEYQRCSASAGYESVAILVKGTTGLGGGVHADRESNANVMLISGSTTNIYLEDLETYDFETLPAYGYQGKMF